MSDLGDPDGIHKSGWLKRKVGIRWAKCHCELHQTELYVRKSEKTQKIDVRLPITSTTVIKLIDHKNKHYLTIDLPEGKPLKLKGKDNDDIVKWFLALRSSTFYNSLLSMDSFDILSVLGRGYYGKVMLVSQKDTGELFAIKTVHKMRLLQSQKVHTILAERNIMRRTEHPFTVKLSFAFQTATKFYLGLEYIAGGDLFGLMKRKSVFSLSQVRLYVAEIALAIDHLHSIGICYRDLKPENVLIGVDGHLKLTDFGLAKDISTFGSTSTFCGTSDFMAPEIVEKKSYSYPVDWWSLGVVMYELLFGRNPFHDDNKAKMFTKIAVADPVFPPTADADAVDFVRKLLKKNPNERGTFETLKNHPFWNGLNFDDVLAKKIAPEYIPEVRDPRSPDNFDAEFTNEQAVDSIATPPLGDKSVFQNFSFMGALDEGHHQDSGDFPMAEQIIEAC